MYTSILLSMDAIGGYNFLLIIVAFAAVFSAVMLLKHHNRRSKFTWVAFAVALLLEIGMDVILYKYYYPFGGYVNHGMRGVWYGGGVILAWIVLSTAVGMIVGHKNKKIKT